LSATAQAFLRKSSRGLYFGPKTIFIIPPPPLSKNFISPPLLTRFCDFYRAHFALILPYFAFIYPFTSHSSFLSPLFFIFFGISPFFSLPFHFSSQMTSDDIYLPIKAEFSFEWSSQSKDSLLKGQGHDIRMG
jgi:hypothetical protein